MLHPEAEIEDGVEIGTGTRVWARSHIRSGARIGRDCVVGECVFVDVGVRLGDRCKVQNNALIYHGTEAEDEVFIGPAACLTNDRHPRAATPEGRLRGAEDWRLDGIRLRHGSSIGAGAVVVAGVNVGRYALVAAGAVVTRDVLDHALVAGCPAHRIGWACACGLTMSADLRCQGCGRAYAERQTGLVERA